MIRGEVKDKGMGTDPGIPLYAPLAYTLLLIFTEDISKMTWHSGSVAFKFIFVWFYRRYDSFCRITEFSKEK